MDIVIVQLFSKLLEMVGIIDEYIKKNITLCDIKSEETYRNKKSEIRQNYISLNSKNKIELFSVLNKDLSDDAPMHVYLLSILLKCTHDIEILDKIVQIICSSNLSLYQTTMLEYQIEYEIFNHDYSPTITYELIRKLHSFNVSNFKISLDVPKNFIAYNDRNQNKIVVITEQLLNIQHAPSKIILEQCYTMQKGLGMEVFLIVCPIHMSLNDQIVWCELMGQSHLKELNGDHILTYTDGKINIEPKSLDGKFIINYKDISINGKQVLFEEQYYSAHKHILREIYEFNPKFVYNMGSIHPLADTCKNFTTVVASTMNYGYPVSDAQILLCLDDNTDMVMKDNEIFSPYNQVLLKHKIQIVVDEPNTWYTRKEFEVPEDDFVIAIIGNRLPLEITDEFIEIIYNLLAKDLRISILLIGQYDNYQIDFDNEKYKNRIHYIGYQRELVSVINIADLYLNPPRKGGGTSALISLYAGVPVVTLPDCDVAGNVGELFICNNYNEMITLINKYMYDNEFYNRQKEWGVKYTHQVSDSTANLIDAITRISTAIMDMEKE